MWEPGAMSSELKEIAGRWYRFVVGGMNPDDVAHLSAMLAETLGLSVPAWNNLGERGQAARAVMPLPKAEASLHQVEKELGHVASSIPVLVPVAPGEDLQALASRIEHEIPRLPSRTSVLLRTSGSTTGRGSLVAMSSEALLASALSTHATLSGPGRWVLAMPAHYVAGLQIVTRSLVAELEPVIVDMSAGFDPAALGDAVTRAARKGERVYVSLVTTALRRVFADLQARAGLARAARVLVGGGPVPKELRAQARERGIAVVATYGMSETGGGCIYDGVPLPGVSVRIEEADHAGIGRIVLAGPMLAEGCWGGSAEIRGSGAMRELWTADRGRLVSSSSTNLDVIPRAAELLASQNLSDAESPLSLEVLGRLDDVIISGGLKIDPAAVETVLTDQPEVAEAVVLGLPDEEWGQVCVAAVLLDPGKVRVDGWAGGSADSAEHDREPERCVLADLRTRLRRALGAQSPKRLLVVEQMPVLSSGKPDRHAIRALFASTAR